QAGEGRRGRRRYRSPCRRAFAACILPAAVDWFGQPFPRDRAMSFELWAAFAVASAIMVAIPGPTVLLVISYALGHGRRPALAIVAGVALGDFTAMTASILGVGALLAASAALFTALKWAGAAYLVYLGVRLWRAPVMEPAAPGAPARALDTRRAFFHAYVVTALNPKSIVFF